jgi:hypothetical protein
LDEGKVVSRKSVVARRHTTTLFDSVEERFDLVASAIKVRAEADRIAAIAFGGMLAHAPFFMASSLIQSAS